MEWVEVEDEIMNDHLEDKRREELGCERTVEVEESSKEVEKAGVGEQNSVWGEEEDDQDLSVAVVEMESLAAVCEGRTNSVWGDDQDDLDLSVASVEVERSIRNKELAKRKLLDKPRRDAKKRKLESQRKEDLANKNKARGMFNKEVTKLMKRTMPGYPTAHPPQDILQKERLNVAKLGRTPVKGWLIGNFKRYMISPLNVIQNIEHPVLTFNFRKCIPKIFSSGHLRLISKKIVKLSS